VLLNVAQHEHPARSSIREIASAKPVVTENHYSNI
jgi:hypothetical protein